MERSDDLLVYTKMQLSVFWEFHSIIMQKLVEPFSIVLYTNVAVSSRGCKPRIQMWNNNTELVFSLSRTKKWNLKPFKKGSQENEML